MYYFANGPPKKAQQVPKMRHGGSAWDVLPVRDVTGLFHPETSRLFTPSNGLVIQLTNYPWTPTIHGEMEGFKF